MFFFRGGQAVEKGTYWEPDAGKKIVLKGDGFLPGDKSRGYFKLPKSYLLVPVLLLGLGLSMAFPYGIGVVIFGLLYVLTRIALFMGVRMKGIFNGLFSAPMIRHQPNRSSFSGVTKWSNHRKGKNKKLTIR